MATALPLLRWTLALGIIGLLGISALYPDRMLFVGPCSWNGSKPAVCWSTQSALPDLPSDYRKLAISWSLQSSDKFAEEVTTTLARRFLSHVPGIPLSKARNEQLAEWLTGVAEKARWPAAR